MEDKKPSNLAQIEDKLEQIEETKLILQSQKESLKNLYDEAITESPLQVGDKVKVNTGRRDGRHIEGIVGKIHFKESRWVKDRSYKFQYEIMKLKKDMSASFFNISYSGDTFSLDKIEKI